MGLRRMTAKEKAGAEAMVRAKLAGGQDVKDVADDIARWLTARGWLPRAATKRARSLVQALMRDGG